MATATSNGVELTQDELVMDALASECVTMKELMALVGDGTVSIKVASPHVDRIDKATVRPAPKTVPSRKTVCPLTKGEFLTQASPVQIDLRGTKVVLKPREFSSGSFGWGFSGKVVLDVGGEDLAVMVSMNLTAIGSKPELS